MPSAACLGKHEVFWFAIKVKQMTCKSIGPGDPCAARGGLNYETGPQGCLAMSQQSHNWVLISKIESTGKGRQAGSLGTNQKYLTKPGFMDNTRLISC